MKNRFHKILSIILSVIMILSVCSVAAIAETGNVPSYYAINGGTGDGRSADTPAASVRAAVESAIADGYAAGDTVRVYIMQNEWTSTSELTYWADISVVGVMATHEFTLEVMPYDTSITTYLLFHNKANGNEYLVLGGPTVFDDITIVNDRNNWDSIALIGNSVTFRDGIKYGSIGTSYGSSVKTYSALMTTLGYYNKNHTVDRQVNLVFENAFVTSDNDIKNSAIILGAQGPETATYNEDVNITFNNSNISAYLNWGNINNNGGTYTFNKNINIDIKSATSITNDKLADAPVVNVAGAVQFIYDSKTDLSGDITSLTGVTVAGGVYTLKDRSSQDDFLTFTATAGTYAVKEGFTAYATDANGTTYASENGLLTVPAGTYTVTEEPPQSSGEGGTTATVKDYFAINGGTGDGRRADAPAASVRAAVEAAIEDGLEVGDTANVYIMQKNWTSTSEFTYWADVSVAGVMATHEFTVEVKPYDTSIITYLLFHNKANANEYLVLGGPTVFDDITLVNDRQNWDAIALLGNSATFRDGVKYASIGTSYGTSVKNYEGLVTVTGYYNKKHTVSDDFNLVFENAFKTADNDIKNSSIYLGGYGPETATYNVDANIVFNNPELSAYLNWGNMNANGSITYNKNVNIDIKAAAKLVNNQIYATTVNVTGGIQFIVAKDTEFICDFTAYEYVTIGGGLYVLRKNTDVEDIITFTKKAGVYAVKEGYNVKATNANGDEFTSANGYITVPSGEYTITEYVPPVTYNYYVKNGGTGDGKTAETPAPTVYAAIETINADGLTANDTANIYIMQREDWNGTEDAVENNITSWATQANIVPPAHEAHIVVQAYDVTITTYLAAHDTLGYNEWLYISGPTTFKNITIVGLRSDYDGISLCGHDVTFGSGTKYGRISNYTSWDGVVDSPFPGLATSMSQGFVKNTYAAQTVVFENDFCGASANRALYINGNGACKATYTEDVNIVFNNSNIECAVYWGNGNVNGPTYFEKNLNVMVKNAKSINNTVGKASVDVAGALQLIVNSSTGWNGDVNTFENVTKGSYWYITNASGLGDILSFTATAGTYDVRTGYTAVATNDETGEEVTSADGSITLVAGKWTVAASKDPEVRNYYVINGGTGDGRSLSSPAATVYDAIVSINADGLIKGDTANVFIMQRSDWNASAGVMVGGSYGAVPHEITAWAVDGATPPAHSALLVVQAYDSNVDTYLTYSDKLGQNTFLVLAGPTVFQNIRLVSQRGYYTQMELAGNSVTFGEGTKYGKIDNDEYAGTASAWNGKVNSYDALATSTGTYSKMATVNEEVNVVFENGYASANKNSSVYIDTTGISTNVYNEDYNIIINNKNAAPTVYLGNAGSAGSSTFNKNLNFVVRDATGLTLAESNNPVTVNGAMQILVNAGAAYTGNVASFANVSVAGGIWTVKVISAVADALSLTDTVGVYNVAEGYIAIATDVNGNKFYSQNGLLNLAAAGEYTVETISDYTHDGETITVYKDCVIDISVVEHTVKDGKVFLGWMDADGEYVPRKAKYYEGDILTASYIDFNESDFAIEQTQIRTEGDLGLRFVVNQNKGALALLPEIVESGAIVLPTDLAGGRDIYLDTPVVLTWKWDDVDKNSFSPDTTGYTPSSVLADNILEESQTNLKYP